MKSYDPTAACPKCGGKTVNTLFQAPHPSFAYGCGLYRCDNPNQEHLHRVCKNCGYGWAEQCMDSAVGVADD